MQVRQVCFLFFGLGLIIDPGCKGTAGLGGRFICCGATPANKNTVLIAQNRRFLHFVGLLAWKATLLQGLLVHELVSGTCQLLPEESNLKLCVLDE